MKILSFNFAIKLDQYVPFFGSDLLLSDDSKELMNISNLFALLLYLFRTMEGDATKEFKMGMS
jgi:hypothetical protein